MATIDVEVPEETHRVLTQRAAAAGQSLQEYLRAALVEQAARPTMAEALARIDALPTTDISVEEVVAAIREDRAGH